MWIKTTLFEFINEQVKSKVYYHGSDNIFDEFSLHNNKGYVENDIPTWFFIQDIEYARKYGKFLYTVELNLTNTFNLENPDHYILFIKSLEYYYGDDAAKIQDILEEEMCNGLPYWTCADAFYAALSNEFDSIIIQEELETEVLSIGVFSIDNISIIKRE